MHSVTFSGDTKSAGLRLVWSGSGTSLGYLTAPWGLQGEDRGDEDGLGGETAAETEEVQTTYITINM